jgi:hypothetical protein
MLDDLVRHAHDTVALRDRIPYVLDLMDGVTRTINAESKGCRTPEFVTWWATVDRSAQQVIHEMRVAELKELRSRTASHVEVEVNVRAIDYSDLLVSDGDTVTRISWVFDGGAFHGQPVFGTLRDYLQKATELLEEAKRKLATKRAR